MKVDRFSTGVQSLSRRAGFSRALFQRFGSTSMTWICDLSLMKLILLDILAREQFPFHGSPTSRDDFEGISRIRKRVGDSTASVLP